MAKQQQNGQLWTLEENKYLKQLIKENTPTRVIGLKLGRTESAVRNHAFKLHLSLKPTNKSPYG